MYKYDLVFTKQFQKDLDLAKKQHIDLSKLFEVIDKLRNDEQLDPVYKDHELSGKHYNGKRECHELNDFLLVFIKDSKSLFFYYIDVVRICIFSKFTILKLILTNKCLKLFEKELSKMKTFKYLVLLATAITCSACDLFDHSSKESERTEISKAEYFLRVDKLPGIDYTSTVSKVTFNEYDLLDGKKNNENSETIFYTGTLELKKAEYEENPRAEEIAALYNNHAMRRSKHMIDEEFIGYTPKFYKFDFGNSQYALELSKNNDKITFEYDWNGYITKYEGKKEVENNNYKVQTFNVERIN